MVLTGVTGSGKSSAGNFFLKRNAFKAGWGLKPVTKEKKSCAGNVGGKEINIVDMPGLLEPSSLTTQNEYSELTDAIFALSNGINALAYVVNVKERFTSGHSQCIKKLLSSNIIPYTFLIFTCAGKYGKTIEKQRQKFQDAKDRDVPEVLKALLKAVNDRYLLLESHEDMEEPDYEEKISHELSEMLQKLEIQNTAPFHSKVTRIPKCFEKADADQKEALKKAFAEDLQTYMSAMNQPNEVDDDTLVDDEVQWGGFLVHITGTVLSGITDNRFVNFFKSLTLSGFSKVFEFISRNKDLISEVAKVAQKEIKDS